MAVRISSSRSLSHQTLVVLLFVLGEKPRCDGYNVMWRDSVFLFDIFKQIKKVCVRRPDHEFFSGEGEPSTEFI